MPTATPRETAASSPHAPMPSASIRQSGRCTSKKRDSAVASKVPASSKSSGHIFGVKRNIVCPCFSNALFAQNAGVAMPAPMRATRTILQYVFSISEAPSFGKGAAQCDAPPCVITISKQRPAETCASSTARPAETKDIQARSSNSASPFRPLRRATRCRQVQGRCRSRRR